VSLAKKTKVALDDSRTLMLGAQILLGFQLQAPFQNAFDALCPLERWLNVLTLVLMIVVAGTLIAPSARHRIVDEGEATVAINEFVTLTAWLSLIPFAMALGLSIGLAMSRVGPHWLAVSAALAVGLGAAAIWLGPALTHGDKSEAVMKSMHDETPLSAKIEYVLTEARVVLPGVQALLGFQLVIVLTRAFEDMPPSAKAVHAVAFVAIALSTVLLLAPATYHRIVYRGEDRPEFYGLASRLILAATVLLVLGLTLDVYVVTFKVMSSQSLALANGALCFAVLIGFWLAWPWWDRQSEARRPSS
jgi:hypothetical protein